MTKKTKDKSLLAKSDKKAEQAKVYIDELSFKYVDQEERWKQEYERYIAVENTLAKLSIFNYKPVDYNALLEPKPWKERTVPDFSYLLDEAKLQASNSFLQPILLKVLAIIVSLIILIISQNVILLWIMGTATITFITWLYITVQKRYEYMNIVISKTKAEIKYKEETERKLIQKEKEDHEYKEKERIKNIEILLSGDISAIFAKLDNVLSTMRLPLNCEIDINMYENTPLVNIWLPPKNIIPNQICTLTASGRPNYEEKESLAINKQYFELCAAIAMQVMLVIYANIPTFDLCYVNGMSKEGLTNECLFSIKFERELFENVCEANNGISALQKASANYMCTPYLDLVPIEEKQPAEWGEVEKKFIRTLTIKTFSNY